MSLLMVCVTLTSKIIDAFLDIANFEDIDFVDLFCWILIKVVRFYGSYFGLFSLFRIPIKVTNWNFFE